MAKTLPLKYCAEEWRRTLPYQAGSTARVKLLQYLFLQCTGQRYDFYLYGTAHITLAWDSSSASTVQRTIP